MNRWPCYTEQCRYTNVLVCLCYYIGVTQWQEVKKLLTYHVENILFGDSIRPKPSVLNRSFYPTNRDIINHIYIATTKQKLSKVDQFNLQRMIEEWTKKDPTSKFLLRTCTAKESDILDQSQPAQKLLYVHQEQWQQRLIVKYGNEISLLDATYKTTNYALPFFFVCVKTNNGYAVVGMYCQPIATVM